MEAIAFPPAFEKAFQAKLDATLAPNLKLKELMKLMSDDKIIHTLPKVNPKLFCVHRMNRGGLGLSPFNVHRNAATIFSVGGDRRALGAALAIELAPSGNPKREEHIGFNKRLIAKSYDLLAVCLCCCKCIVFGKFERKNQHGACRSMGTGTHTLYMSILSIGTPGTRSNSGICLI